MATGSDQQGAWAVLRTSVAEGAKPPTVRGGHTAVLVEKNLIVQGGQQHKSGGVFEYFSLNPHVLDTETHTWFEPRVALGKGPTPRAYHTSTRVGSGLYIFGGSTAKKAGESGLLGDLVIFNLVSMAWESKDVRGKKPRSRFMHSAELSDGKLFVYGGSDGTKSLSDVNVLDVTTMLWSQPQVSGSIPPGLQAHSCTLVGDRLFLVGGMTVSSDEKAHSFIKYSNDVYVLSTDRCDTPPAASSTPQPAHPSRGPSLALHPLGLTITPRSLGVCSMEWMRLQQRGELPKPRSYHASAVVGNFLVVLGGWSGACENLSTLSTLDLDGLGTWASVTVPGQPPAGVYGHTATVLGSNILLFGGWDGVSPLSAVNVLDTTKLG